MLSHNPVHHRTKHMELDVFFVRAIAKKLSVRHMPTMFLAAAIFTKHLSTLGFEYLKTKLKVADATLPTLTIREAIGYAAVV